MMMEMMIANHSMILLLVLDGLAVGIWVVPLVEKVVQGADAVESGVVGIVKIWDGPE